MVADCSRQPTKSCFREHRLIGARVMRNLFQGLMPEHGFKLVRTRPSFGEQHRRSFAQPCGAQ